MEKPTRCGNCGSPLWTESQWEVSCHNPDCVEYREVFNWATLDLPDEAYMQVQCDQCNGTGIVYRGWDNSENDCPKCEGEGWI